MGRNDQPARLGPYAQELLENAYAQERFRDGVEKLQAAYRRARKRRVEPIRDERLRRQVQSAAQSITEAGRALRSGRRKPERRWRTRVAVVGGLGAAGAVAGIWAKDRLSGGSALSEQPASAPTGGTGERTDDPAAA